MEHLGRTLLHAVTWRVQQIAVALAKGVVHLHHDGTQAAALVIGSAVAVPEAHRLEGKAQHARVAVQPHFAGGILNAFAVQQLVQPGNGTTLCGRAAIAVVGFEETYRPSAVDGPRMRLFSAVFNRRRPGRHGLFCLYRLAQAAQRQHQKIGGVGEGVLFWPRPRVAHLPEADQWGGVHRTPSVARPTSANNCAAAASPALRPSSWKP